MLDNRAEELAVGDTLAVDIPVEDNQAVVENFAPDMAVADSRWAHQLGDTRSSAARVEAADRAVPVSAAGGLPDADTCSSVVGPALASGI